MPDRNSSVGTVFLITGVVLAALGYLVSQSIPIAAFGFALATIGAIVLILVPEVVPQTAYGALLKDSVSNIEIILEESELKERAFFVPTSENEIRAFIPLKAEERSKQIEASPSIVALSKSGASTTLGSFLLETMEKAPKRFFTDYGGMQGLVLVPPGSEIVRLSKIARGEEDLEETLREALVTFSDLARSVLVIEEEKSDILKIQIRGARVHSDAPYFSYCFGSVVSCVAACIVCYVKGKPVRIVDEKIFDPSNVTLSLELID
jgi:hypothetical protein